MEQGFYDQIIGDGPIPATLQISFFGTGTTKKIQQGPEGPGSDGGRGTDSGTVHEPSSEEGDRPDQESAGSITDLNPPESTPPLSKQPEGPGVRFSGSGRPGTGMAPTGSHPDNAPSAQGTDEGSQGAIRPGHRGTEPSGEFQEGTVRVNPGGVFGTGPRTTVDYDITNLLDFSE